MGTAPPDGNGGFPFDDSLDLGLSAMSTARFWTGIFMLTGLAMAIILAISPREREEPGPVEGTVTYRGRPVAGGSIYFLAEGRPLGDSVHAVIDRYGHYECHMSWRWDRTAAKRFRIFVHLDEADEPSRYSTTAEVVQGDRDDGNPVSARSPDGGARPVARASMESPNRDLPDRGGTSWNRHRFNNPYTSDLAVRLTAEPVRVDVALKD